ncbi:MAG TPA: hypothetical protein VLY04_26175 [Bryobacteraceae bacterium]|nr:hypothetical protein [Bryobacteraceae bacterium]
MTKKTVFLFLGALILVTVLPFVAMSPATALIPFAAPLIYIIFVVPKLIRPNG